jgi:translation elongation factor EF-Tu-like GTPase
MFRMTVEDVFVIRNRGVVATGRVEGGTLRVGDTVQINGTLECCSRRSRRAKSTADPSSQRPGSFVRSER